ncbi:hypothetical protein HOT49_gp035 [Erwinia phage vB_EamM_Alexandra]|uniref:Uncharacterized protein n=1 Tax=Erwinia phage vB_EamM_Alexandra TaxID=2201424 RepID=A0A2Z4QDH7_9CAUD|nr:hypothetical protein HOT49_gp035 [Erwinia phage vB_EamM_Alexandra]AWY08315.1 hypothetical protein Alexandra_35 [Erwinia phage vB_EamM_Alexandra]
MQTAYRCKHCKYVHVGKVSSCDCNNARFEYTLVHIIDVPENEEQVPPFKDLRHSREQMIVNYKDGQTGNGIYAYLGTRESIAGGTRPDTQMLGTMSSTIERGSQTYRQQEANQRANCVLAAAGPELLEVAYMCYQYFNLKREVQGSSIKNDSRISIIAETIRKATDISVYDTPQDFKYD